MKSNFIKNATKFRVRIDNKYSFYTSAGDIRKGIGDSISMNAAVVYAMAALEFQMLKDPAVGLVGTWNGYQIQIDILK